MESPLLPSSRGSVVIELYGSLGRSVRDGLGLLEEIGIGVLEV